MIITKAKVLIPRSEVEKGFLRKIERYARVCYKSEDKLGEEVNQNFLGSIIKHGHESVIEHEKITLMFVTDRGITHEIVRHRVGSYSQESTRYCNYINEKFCNELSKKSCEQAEKNYFALLEAGSTPQEARSVLPNSLKTEIVVTYNLREWRHFLKLRSAKGAHPQVKEIAIPLLLAFKEILPVLFKDIPYEEDFAPENYAEIIYTDDFFNPVEGV